ncbi:hypothetical protein THAR02_08255 [Trichoderma harzianum]|uniref:Oxidoreductase acuF-like C2H2 type zinc-finger domain-containing protein n=1 Tax=Trichoderma harzianum TaxID=5544 RepID=A0A0F9ZH94_TRIHA|nr:hypothetical protein THAR02_08255 [Trichoderma harzianum]
MQPLTLATPRPIANLSSSIDPEAKLVTVGFCVSEPGAMESLMDTGLATMKRFKLLQEVELKSVEYQSQESPKQPFLAQFDRFELWAVNLGVFVMGHGSLDYRIRDSETLAYLCGDIEQEDEDEDTDSCSEMESDMDLLLDSIKDPIDRLYKMAVWIRNPATRITSTKARNLQQVDEETNVDLFKSFEKFDYEHISSLFLEYEKNKAIQENPIANPHNTVGNDEALFGDQVWEPIRKTLELNRMQISNGDESYLVRRIARANGLRRQQFAYWKKHKNKLREHAAVVVEVPAHNMPTTNHIIQLEDRNKKAKAPLTVTTATQLRLSHGIGQELEKENVMTFAVSEYAPSAWNPSKDIVSFPSPPKASPDDFFECPYCYTICPASILSEKAWSSEQLYDSRDDWIEHEISRHQTVFRCPMHEEETFTTLATYDEHAQKYHTEDAMPSGLATPTVADIHRSCPICSIVLGTVQKLQSHIALHLERFAMFTLPRCTDDSDEGSSSGRSASAHVDSNRSLAGDLDTESNATGNSQHDSILSYETRFNDQAQTQTQIEIEQSRAMISLHDAAAQGSLTTLDPYKSSSIHFDVDEIDRKGRTALAWAALKGHIDVVKLLLSENANVNHTDEKNRTALWYASVSHHSSVPQQRRREVIEYLLLKGADPDVQAKDGSTALMKLIQHRDSDAIRLLTQKGASTTIVVEKREIIAALLSPDGIASRDKERFFFQEMEEIKFQLKNYGRIVRVWPPGNTTNITLFELGDTCIEAGLIDEAIKTLELLKFLQVSVFEYDDQGLLPTEQRLARAYEVNEALQEVDEQLGQGANLHIEPNKSKALDIFARTEAGMRHAQTIWGPNISNIQQIPQDTVDKTQQESYGQAQQLAMDLAQEDPEVAKDGLASDSKRYIEEIKFGENHMRREDSHLLPDAVENLRPESAGAERGLKSDPLDEKSQDWIAEIEEPQHDQRQEMLSGTFVPSPPDEFMLHGGRLLGQRSGDSRFDYPRQLESIEVGFSETRVAEDVIHKLPPPSTPNQSHYVPTSPPVLRPDMRSRPHDEGLDAHEGVDHAGHSRQDPSRADHDRRVPMDPPEITEFASERYYEKLRQLQADHQQANEAESDATTTTTAFEFILPLQDSSNPTDEIPQPSARGKKGFLSLKKKAVANASDDLNAVNAIAEQETTDNSHQLSEEDYRYTKLEEDMESELTKREARETPEAREARKARIIQRIANANFELSDHEEMKRRLIERREEALEAMHADRGREDSSAAPGELEAQDPSTEVSVKTETSRSELNYYQEWISAEEEKIRDGLEKIEPLEEELGLFRAEKEVQIPSGSEGTWKGLPRVFTWECFFGNREIRHD